MSGSNASMRRELVRSLIENLITADWESEEITRGLTVALDAFNQLMHDTDEVVRAGLEIHAEYLSQIKNMVSQDYARLNTFPALCAAVTP